MSLWYFLSNIPRDQSLGKHRTTTVGITPGMLNTARGSTSFVSHRTRTAPGGSPVVEVERERARRQGGNGASGKGRSGAVVVSGRTAWGSRERKPALCNISLRGKTPLGTDTLTASLEAREACKRDHTEDTSPGEVFSTVWRCQRGQKEEGRRGT